MLPMAQEMVPDVSRTEGVTAEGSPDTALVAEGTSGELSLALTSGVSHPPTRDEPLLQWVSPWDLSSGLFTLDDATEGMEQENLNEGSWPR